MAGFKLENTSSQRCMPTRQCDLERIEDKLDYLIRKVDDMDGIKGFGVNLAANVLGNFIDFSKR